MLTRQKDTGAAVRTSLVLPENLWKRLKFQAAEERSDLRSILIRAAEGYLKAHAKKGGQVMGVKVRKKGDAWYVFINHGKRRKAKAVGRGPEGKRAAEAVAGKIQAKLTLGEFGLPRDDAPRPALFREYAGKWLAAQTHLKPITAHTYQATLDKHVLPTFGDLPIPGITRKHVREWIAAKLAEGLDWNTVKLALAPLRSCLMQAVEDEMIGGNPATRMGKMLSRREANPDDAGPDAFTREELPRLLEIAREKWPRDYPHLLCLARTGMRIGESFALGWDDVDFGAGRLRVARSVSASRGHPFHVSAIAETAKRSRRACCNRYRTPFRAYGVDLVGPRGQISVGTGHH